MVVLKRARGNSWRGVSLIYNAERDSATEMGNFTEKRTQEKWYCRGDFFVKGEGFAEQRVDECLRLQSERLKICVMHNN